MRTSYRISASAKTLKHTSGETVETVPSVVRYAPHSHVLALSPQEASTEEVGPLWFCGRHLLDIRVQLGDSQQGKHVMLPLYVFFRIRN